MAISSSTRKAGPFIGNDVTTVFPFAFKVFTAADLRVVNTNALGVESDLLIDVDYTVSLNADQDNDPGGSITRASALPVGQRLTITSDVEALQPLVLTNNGGFYPRVINDAFDKITIIAQQLIEQVSRSLKLPISSTASATLPDPAANHLIAWNSSASGFTNVDAATVATLAAYADAAIELFDGDGAQTAFVLENDPGVLANLSVSVSGVVQVGGEDFTCSGVTLTFSTAPPAGTRIQVRYTRALTPVDLASSAALKANNLADLTSASAARANLGGTATGVALFTAASAAAAAESLLVRPETFSQASGVDVLEAVTTGVRNTGFGFEALKANTGGSENTAFGYLALNSVTGGVDPVANYNTAFGSFALAEVTTGYKNAAFGRATGDNLTTGYHDTALGYGAMHWHTTALNCVGVGFEAVHGGTGLVGTAMQGTVGVGFQALYAATGNFNTAVGTSAGVAITTGVRNTAIGTNALNNQTTASDTTAIGYAAGTTNTGSGNIFIGQNADANAGLANVTVIGTGLTATAANSILMGNGQDLLPGSTARDVGSQAKPWNYMIGANSFYAHCNTAVPAGGTTGAGFLLSSTGNFGIFFGSGAPTLSAAKGSLYLRSDGSGTNDRMYVNTNGGTTWTAVVTVA